MDINSLRVLVTVISFLLFVGIVLWAWSDSNRARFEEAARLPFAADGDDGVAPEPPKEKS